MRPFTKILMMAVVASALTLSANAFDGTSSHKVQKTGLDNMPSRGMEKPDKRRGNPIRNMLKEINLSAEQIKTLQALAETFKTEREALGDNRGNRDQDLADAISESGLNSAQLTQIALERCEARSTMQFDHLAQIVDVLTAQQRLEFKALLEAKAERTGEPLKNLGY